MPIVRADRQAESGEVDRDAEEVRFERLEWSVIFVATARMRDDDFRIRRFVFYRDASAKLLFLQRCFHVQRLSRRGSAASREPIDVECRHQSRG